MSEVKTKGKKALQASRKIGCLTTEEKNEGLRFIANQLLENQPMILAENEKDLHAGKKNGLSEAVLDRIMLNEQRIDDMSNAYLLRIIL